MMMMMGMPRAHRKCESVELFCRLIIHHPHIR